MMTSGFARTLIAVSAAWMAIGPATAQDRDALRAQTRQLAAQLRALGEPKDRCSLGVTFLDGGLVIDTYAATPLVLGDHVVSLNGTDVRAMSNDQIIGLLRATAPGTSLSAVVHRGTQNLPLQLVCANSRAQYEVFLAGLDQAARGHFEECAQTFGSRSDMSLPGATMRLQCAAAARHPEQQNVGQYAYEVAQYAIRVGNWVPAKRPDIVRQLRAVEGMITQARGTAAFQDLINLTHAWSGDERAWEGSEPDWALFRRNAEMALRNRLVDPDSARIEWPNGFLMGTWQPLLSRRIEGYWTCGLINARNRMGGYVGATSFVVVLNADGQVLFSDVGSGRDFDILSSQCSRSVRLLPPPPLALAPSAPQRAEAGQPSLADELERLTQLRDRGAITQAEFEAAKARLLAPPNH